MVTEDYLDKNLCKLGDIKGRRIDAPRNSAGEKKSMIHRSHSHVAPKREIFGKLPEAQAENGKI
jgi:hypothetical protein